MNEETPLLFPDENDGDNVWMIHFDPDAEQLTIKTYPLTEMPELMRECQRKGGDTYRTRMVIIQVELRRAVITMASALVRLGYQFQRFAEATGQLTKPRRKR